LEAGDIARAQVAALLLRLPDPPAPGEADPRRLTRELAACGMLKADDGWDEQHPRTGTAPNPGWFAPKDTDSEADDRAGASDSPGGEHAFAPTAPAAGSASVLAEGLSASVMEGLATLAGRASVPTILLGAIFVPSANRLVDEGAVPGRPDMT
jgi:hypothetical protein